MLPSRVPKSSIRGALAKELPNIAPHLVMVSRPRACLIVTPNLQAPQRPHPGRGAIIVFHSPAGSALHQVLHAGHAPAVRCHHQGCAASRASAVTAGETCTLTLFLLLFLYRREANRAPGPIHATRRDAAAYKAGGPAKPSQVCMSTSGALKQVIVRSPDHAGMTPGHQRVSPVARHLVGKPEEHDGIAEPGAGLPCLPVLELEGTEHWLAFGIKLRRHVPFLVVPRDLRFDRSIRDRERGCSVPEALLLPLRQLERPKKVSYGTFVYL